MRTGEGKTLTIVLAAYLNALEKKGVHIVTVNDYLAKSVKELIAEEEAYGLKKLKTYIDFGEKIQNLKKNVINNLQKLKKERRRSLRST